MRNILLILMLILSVKSYATNDIKNAYCTADLASSSYHIDLEYEGGHYVESLLKKKNMHISYVSKYDSKQSIINTFIAKGWELDSQDGDRLRFRIDMSKPAGALSNAYCTADLASSSYHIDLEYEGGHYVESLLKKKNMHISYVSKYDSKQSIINTFIAKGWELYSQDGDRLRFRIDMSKPAGALSNAYCTADLASSSYHIDLEYEGGHYVESLLKKKNMHISYVSKYDSKQSIINTFIAKGWELYSQDGDRLRFRIDMSKPAGALSNAYCTADLASSSYHIDLEYEGGHYVESLLKKKNTHISYVSKYDSKQSIINTFIAKGWELYSQDGDRLRFQIDMSKPAGALSNAYCTVDLASSSYHIDLEYEGGHYVESLLKKKNMHISYVSKYDSKQSIINTFIAKGWELYSQDGDKLRFRIDVN